MNIVLVWYGNRNCLDGPRTSQQGSPLCASSSCYETMILHCSGAMPRQLFVPDFASLKHSLEVQCTPNPLKVDVTIPWEYTCT